jgi:hypothetical protein
MPRLIKVFLLLANGISGILWIVQTGLLLYWAIRPPFGATGIAYGIAHSFQSSALIPLPQRGGFLIPVPDVIEARHQTVGFFLLYILVIYAWAFFWWLLRKLSRAKVHG